MKANQIREGARLLVCNGKDEETGNPILQAVVVDTVIRIPTVGNRQKFIAQYHYVCAPDLILTTRTPSTFVL